MRPSYVARHRVGLVSALVVVAAVGALVAYALAVPGFKARHADLDDGGVWITRGGSYGQFGRLNNPIKQLDGFLGTPGGAQTTYNIDVLQDGSAILAEDDASGVAYPVDPAGVAAVNAAKVPFGGSDTLAMAGGTIALLDPAKGAVRAVSYDPTQPLGDIAGLAEGKPLATLGSGAALTVAQDGTIFGVSGSSGRLTTIRPTSTGFGRPGTTKLSALSGSVQITAVGDQPVVLATNASTATVVLPGGKHVQLSDGGTGLLQQAGPHSDAVLVATTTSLQSIPLDGSARTTLFRGAAGTPAAPVYRQQCAYAAWAGQPAYYASTCFAKAGIQNLGSSPGPLVFRTNRNQVVLNDRSTGQTWNLDNARPLSVANWDQIKQKTDKPNKHQKKNDKNTNQANLLPPVAKPDDLGARPGRATTLYVLDNDSDPAGQTLAVERVSAVSGKQSWLSVAPDGQSVTIALPATQTDEVRFSYVVRAAQGKAATAAVTVHARPLSGTDSAPTPRKPAPKPIAISVPQGGTVTVPVLADWRDYKDGDPVVLKGTTPPAAGAGRLAGTPDGDLVYTAPARAGTHELDYTVTDAQGATAAGHQAVTVQALDAKPVAATARPDYARGRVGVPITVSPLGNDLPGSDPLHPTATMKLVGRIAQPTGTTVSTDPTTGIVTVVGKRVGSVVLTYQVGYGGAPPSSSSIRIDVDPASASSQPVTAPDVAVLRGLQSVTVDVLANDSDPAGNLLVVQSATPDDENALRVAVIGGRYLRIAPAAGMLSSSHTIKYSVTDGVTGLVQGEVSVEQLPAAAYDTPVTLDDYATVRGGQSVAIPVLDNDVSPSGGTLSLVRSVAGRPSGTFAVSPASAGRAYASGRVVRFVAPTVRAVSTATVDYYALNEAGTQQQLGHATVTITPPPSATNPNQPPAPAPVEARAIAGQTIRIKVPTSGVDPDGDAVSVAGVGSATTLGRVLGFTATSLSYQAYPLAGNGGTDTFDYQVTDTQGATAKGSIRVAVVRPGDPQPPVAVDDTVTVAPGATVQVDALANDLVAAGDDVRIDPLTKTNPSLPAGVRLASATGPVVVRAGADVRHPVQITYQLDDGLHVSGRATITVRAQRKVNLPPVAFDQFARPKAGDNLVTVDVTHGDYDPDSSTRLAVVTPASTDGKVTLPVRKYPQVVPYVVADSEGAQASAAVYVPGVGSGLAYAKPGAQISVPTGRSITVDITKYVIDPANKRLHTTTANTISASPSAKLMARAGSDGTHLVLTGASGYSGPAAVTFNVTNGASLSTPGAVVSTVTVPVQVGAKTPVLNCPSTGIDAVAGGGPVALPITTLCHVWSPTPAGTAALRYHVAWQKQPAGFTRGAQDTARPTVEASGGTRPGTTGTLIVSVVGSNAVPGRLSVQALKAPNLTVSPITVEGVKAGDTKRLDLAAYVSSPLRDARVEVLGKPRASGAIPTQATAAGSVITLVPAKRGSGRVVVSFVVTDARKNPGRSVTAQLVMTVIGPPDAPTGLAAGRTVKDAEVDLTWNAPNDHGAPITNYVAKFNGGSRDCGAAPACAVTGLRNGQHYSFTVVAVNAVGMSPLSNTAPGTPDRKPDAVTGFTGSNPQDGKLTLTWIPGHGTYSPVTKYTISWSSSSGSGGQQNAAAGSRSTTVSGLDNDTIYNFHIQAFNAQGYGQPATAGGLLESAGRPGTPVAPSTKVETDTSSNNEVIVLGGYAVDPNGPAPTRYTITRTSGGSSKAVCSDTTATSCTDTGVQLDGTTYSYSVTARYAATGSRFSSAPSRPASVEAAATPDPITSVSLQATGNDQEATVSFTAPPSHGKTSTVTCTISTGGNCQGWNPTFPTSGRADTQTITGFTNGNAATVTLQECNGSSGGNQSGTSCDAAVVSNQATTYGPIGVLQISVGASQYRSVNWSVSYNPNGKPMHVVVTVNGQVFQQFDTDAGVGDESRSFTDDIGYSNRVSIGASATDGKRSRDAQPQSASTGPQPSITVAEGGSGRTTYCTTTGCRQIQVNLHNFAPNTTYTLYFDTDCAGINPKSCEGGNDNSGKHHYVSEKVSTDSSGNAYSGDRYFGYTGSNVWTDVDIPGANIESNHVNWAA